MSKTVTIEPLRSDTTARVPSVSVVGNSGALLKTSFGRAIDSHTAVFRLNHAPAGGDLSASVGTKTTYRVLNRQWSHRYASGRLNCDRSNDCSSGGAAGSGVWLAIRPPDKEVCARLVKRAAEAVWRSANRRSPGTGGGEGPPAALCASYAVMGRVRTLYYAFLESLARCDRRGSTPNRLVSSGLGAWVVALHMCQRVTLYGFGNSGGSAYKYFRFGRSRVHRDHNLDAEKMFAEGLAALYGGRKAGKGVGVAPSVAPWPPLTFCSLRADPDCGT